MFGKDGVDPPPSSPAAWAGACGCTTSPAGARIGKLHKRLDKDEALALHAHAARATGWRRPTCTTTPRPTTPASCSPWPAPRRSTTAPSSPTACAVTGIDQGRRRPGRRASSVEADGETLHDPAPRSWSTPPASGPTTSASLDEGTHPDSIRPAKGIHITVPWDMVRNDIAAVVPVPEGPPLGLRRAVGRAHLHRHHRHRLRRPGRRPAVHARGRRLPAATRINALVHHRDHHGRRRRHLGRPAAAGEGGRRAAAPPTSPAATRSHASRRGVVTITGRQAHDLPRDGRGHRRRGRRRGPRPPERLRPASPTQPHRSSRCAAPTATTRCPRPARPHRRGRPTCVEHLGRPLRRRGPRVDGHDRSRSVAGRAVVPGLPYLGPRPSFAVRYEMARSVDDVLSRRTRARSWPATTRPRPPPRSPTSSAAELGWDAAERGRRSRTSARRCEHERARRRTFPRPTSTAVLDS